MRAPVPIDEKTRARTFAAHKPETVRWVNVDPMRRRIACEVPERAPLDERLTIFDHGCRACVLALGAVAVNESTTETGVAFRAIYAELAPTWGLPPLPLPPLL